MDVMLPWRVPVTGIENFPELFDSKELFICSSLFSTKSYA